MAYRRKLTALFISAAFVLTLALSFFFIAKELSHDHGQSGDPCPICEKIDLCLRTLSVCQLRCICHAADDICLFA